MQPTTTIREIVGVFHDADALNGAISDLLGAGIDRAALSVIAQEGLLDGTPGDASDDTRRTADDAATPRQTVYTDTDVRQGRVLVTSMASTVAALAASGIVVLSGGAAAVALLAAVGAGGGTGALGALVGKRAGDERKRYLEDQLDRGGILLWVKIMRPESEARIAEILKRHAADSVHAHDIDAHAPGSAGAR